MTKRETSLYQIEKFLHFLNMISSFVETVESKYLMSIFNLDAVF